MSRKPVKVAMCMDRDVVSRLKRAARKRSRAEGRQFTIGELTEETLLAAVLRPKRKAKVIKRTAASGVCQ